MLLDGILLPGHFQFLGSCFQGFTGDALGFRREVRQEAILPEPVGQLFQAVGKFPLLAFQFGQFVLLIKHLALGCLSLGICFKPLGVRQILFEVSPDRLQNVPQFVLLVHHVLAAGEVGFGVDQDSPFFGPDFIGTGHGAVVRRAHAVFQGLPIGQIERCQIQLEIPLDFASAQILSPG